MNITVEQPHDTARAFIRELLADCCQPHADNQEAMAFAPSNVAVCKYWGKRDVALNLPMTDSLSVSLGDYGATTRVCWQRERHAVYINGRQLAEGSPAYQRVHQFLQLFPRPAKHYYRITSDMNLPISAGLASSACGFAALVKALDRFHRWHLPESALSMLARIGSGSASRSLWHGFVHWSAGDDELGLDSYAKPLSYQWPELRIGLWLLNRETKPLSSRQAMQRTVATSLLYRAWPEQVARDIKALLLSIRGQDFATFGETAENNALAMHATMLSAKPAISYGTPATWEAIRRVWAWRDAGISVYFTQDAGPNIKLLFLASQEAELQALCPELKIIRPFEFTHAQ